MSAYQDLISRWPDIAKTAEASYAAIVRMGDAAAQEVYDEFISTMARAKRDVDATIAIHESYPDNFTPEQRASAKANRADLLTILRGVSAAYHKGEAIYTEAVASSGKAAAVSGLGAFYAASLPLDRAASLPTSVGWVQVVAVAVAVAVIASSAAAIAYTVGRIGEELVLAQREKTRIDAGLGVLPPDSRKKPLVPWYVPAAGVGALALSAVAYKFMA